MLGSDSSGYKHFRLTNAVPLVEACWESDFITSLVSVFFLPSLGLCLRSFSEPQHSWWRRRIKDFQETLNLLHTAMTEQRQ